MEVEALVSTLQFMHKIKAFVVIIKQGQMDGRVSLKQKKKKKNDAVFLAAASTSTLLQIQLVLVQSPCKKT